MSIPATSVTPPTAVRIAVTPSTGTLAVTVGRLYCGAVNQVALMHATDYASWGPYGVLRLTAKPDQQWSPSLVEWTAVCDAIAGVDELYLGGTLDLTAAAIRSWAGSGPKTARLELWDETADLVVAHGQVQIHPSLTYEDDVADTAVPSRSLTDAQIAALITAGGGGKPASEKVTPVDADGVTLWDSLFGWAGKFVSWADIKTALGLLYAPIAHLTDAAAHAALFGAKLATSTFTAHSAATSGTHGTTLINARTPTAHAETHTIGADQISVADPYEGGHKGLMSAADALKLYGIEAGAQACSAPNMGTATDALDAIVTLGFGDLFFLRTKPSNGEKKLTWQTLAGAAWSYIRTYSDVTALPPVSYTGIVYRLTADDDVAAAAPGYYLRGPSAGQWVCIAPLSAFVANQPDIDPPVWPALPAIPGCAYIVNVSQETPSWTATFCVPGLITVHKRGAFAIALPTMSGRTTVVAGSGGWDAASAALARITIEDDGTYLSCKAEALS